MNKLKKYMKFFVVYIVIIVLYIALLTFTANIPNKMIKNNVMESSRELLEKNEKTVVNFLGKKIVLFNFTDALMINTIYSTDDEKTLETVLLARRNYIKNSNKKIYKDTMPPGFNEDKSAEYEEFSYQTKELWETVNGRDTYNCIEYARYWHGYMIILKPLLILFKYSQIQILSYIVYGILSIIFLYLVTKKIGLKEAVAYFLAVIISDIYICSISLNAIVPFYISIIAGILILVYKDRIKNYNFLFFIIGSLTAFFDFLTTPLVTLGIPLILRILIYQKEEKRTFIEMLKVCIWWGIGYFTTMILKWVITDILFNRNVIATSIKQLLYRIGNESEETKYTFLTTLLSNLYFINVYVFSFVFLCMICTLIIKLIKGKFNDLDICLLLISTLPLFWFLFLKNHSTKHSFFTYRNLIITIICYLILILNNINFYINKENKK